MASCCPWLSNSQEPRDHPQPGRRPGSGQCPQGWVQIVLTMHLATQQRWGTRVGRGWLLSSPQLTPRLWLKIIPPQETCCCWHGGTMHKTSAGWVSSSEWLHSENARVKGLCGESLGFLEGLSSPSLCLGPQPLHSMPGTSAPRAAHTEGSQVGLAGSSSLLPISLTAFLWTPLVKKEELTWQEAGSPGFESCFFHIPMVSKCLWVSHLADKEML